MSVNADRARKILGAMQAFATLAEIHEVKLVVLVRGEPMDAGCTPAELAVLLGRAVGDQAEEPRRPKP
jgi:hypothetical protein